MNLKDYRKKVDEKHQQYLLAAKVYKQEKEFLVKAEQDVVDLDQAQQILQQIAQGLQQQAHKQIATVVSKCLEAVFEEPYDFQIIFDRKRGKTEARLVFVRDGEEVDPLTASGGGVVDVAAFALRLACLALSRPKVRRLVVMDEPFKFLSAEYRPRIKELLEKLAEEMDFQFVLVTHLEDLQIGNVVEL